MLDNGLKIKNLSEITSGYRYVKTLWCWYEMEGFILYYSITKYFFICCLQMQFQTIIKSDVAIITARSETQYRLFMILFQQLLANAYMPDSNRKWRDVLMSLRPFMLSCDLFCVKMTCKTITQISIFKSFIKSLQYKIVWFTLVIGGFVIFVILY